MWCSVDSTSEVLASSMLLLSITGSGKVWRCALGSSVSVVTRLRIWRTGSRDSIPGSVETGSGANQSPIRWVPGFFPHRVMLATHLHLVRASRSYFSVPAFIFMAWGLINHVDKFPLHSSLWFMLYEGDGLQNPSFWAFRYNRTVSWSVWPLPPGCWPYDCCLVWSVLTGDRDSSPASK
jgi:hypothetical protein